MKIAILGSFNFHLECIANLLEIYKNRSVIDIYLSKKSDKFNWVKYYLTIYNFNVIYDKFSLDIINNYDKIFKLSENDNCLNHDKIISILHLKNNKINYKNRKFISLTPYIQGKNIYNIFPIHSPILNNNLNINKIVTMITYNNNYDIDFINFIKKNSNYYFYFVNHPNNYYGIKFPNNVKLLSYIQTDVMNNLIINSKFILSNKIINNDRFCGQLSLAMSYEKPLIIDTKTKKIYNLPGIEFDKNYSEIGDLDNITDEKYQRLKNEIKILKHNILKKNKEILDSVF